MRGLIDGKMRDHDTYTHLGLEDAAAEMKRMDGLQDARKELEKTGAISPVQFRAAK